MNTSQESYDSTIEESMRLSVELDKIDGQFRCWVYGGKSIHDTKKLWVSPLLATAQEAMKLAGDFIQTCGIETAVKQPKVCDACKYPICGENYEIGHRKDCPNDKGEEQ